MTTLLQLRPKFDYGLVSWVFVVLFLFGIALGGVSYLLGRYMPNGNFALLGLLHFLAHIVAMGLVARNIIWLILYRGASGKVKQRVVAVQSCILVLCIAYPVIPNMGLSASQIFARGLRARVNRKDYIESVQEWLLEFSRKGLVEETLDIVRNGKAQLDWPPAIEAWNARGVHLLRTNEGDLKIRCWWGRGIDPHRGVQIAPARSDMSDHSVDEGVVLDDIEREEYRLPIRNGAYVWIDYGA